MKTNATKFLAVLAVLAMAFAAFAIIAPAESNDAADVVVTDITETLTIPSTATAEANYYINMATVGADAELKVEGTAAFTVYLYGAEKNGYDLTVKITGTGATVKLCLTSSTSVTSDKKITPIDGLTVPATTDKVYTADSTTKCIVSTNDDATGATYGVEYKATAVTGSAVALYYFYAEGATVADITLKANEVAIVKDAKVTVKQAGKYDGTPRVGSLTFTGDTSALGITLTGTATYMTVSGIVKENNKNVLTVGGGLAVVGDGLSFAGTPAPTVPSINTATGEKTYTEGSFPNGAYLFGADWSPSTTKATFVYNNLDITFTYKNSNSITFVNSTGTVTVQDTSKLVISTEKFNGTLTPSVSAGKVSGAIATTGSTHGNLILKEGAFTADNLTFTGNLNVAANATLTTSGEMNMTGDLIVRGTLVLGNALNLTGNGSIYGTIKSDSTTEQTITVNAPVKESKATAVVFKAYDGSSLVYVKVQKGESNPDYITIDLSGATSTVYLSGTISTSQKFGQTQNVVVDGDLEIKDNAKIEILGGFQINDDVRMTITSGQVIVSGAGVDVVIDGELYIDDNGSFTVDAKAKSVKINGVVENEGTMAINTKDVTVAKDGKMIIGDTSDATTLDKISIAAGGLLQINGKIGESTITNKGSVVFNEAILNGDVEVIMNGDGAVVSVISATTVDKGSNAATTLTITDNGMDKPTGYPTQLYVNKITLTTTAAGDGFSGIGVAQTVSTVALTKTVVSKFTVAGNYAAVKATTGDTPAETTMIMTSDGTENANFSFTDGFTIGAGATVDVKTLTTVDYDMYVIGGSDTTKATLKGELIVNGVIAGNNFAAIDGTSFHAATFSVGLGTDKVTYYASIENAVDILEDYTEPISLTISGTKLVVDESVTIPSNISLKGTATFTIGSNSDNTVIMDVKNGSSIASGLTIYVKGTLYLENAKDLKTTNVYSDVKTTDGTDLCFTNLYTALENAEAGDTVEVTATELKIIKSIVIPEGVTLYIPAGIPAEVDVSKKVTITVNGTLKVDGITGPFEDKVSATAAVLVVNGIFMTSETKDIAKVNEKYKAAGAYYYISDDVGDFVYISSLADGVETAAKTFSIYGTVTEITPIELTGKTVTITEGSELIAAAISLSKSTIDVTLGELTAVIYGGDGVSSLAVTDFVFGQIQDTYNSTDKVNELSVGNIGGTVVIMTGTVFTNVANVDADDESSFTVMPGAIFYIPVEMVTYLDSSAAIMGDIVVAGTLYIKSKDVAVTGDITVLADSEEGIHGTLNVSAMSFVSGVITVMDDATFNLTGTITAGVEPTELGAAATIVGNVTTDYAIIAYPGADMDGMTINKKEPVSTEFYINDELFMTAYSAANKVLISNVISEPDYEFPDYKVPKNIKTDVTLWGATATTKVGDVDSLSIELALQDVVITTSWANGLALYIDGARIMSATATLTVGIHTVSASVNAGYACDNITITFNGVAVPVTKEGTVIVLAVDDTGSILAVSGDVYIPEPEPVTPEEKSEWTITTILLVVLVILIAIMAVIVALRLNRS